MMERRRMLIWPNVLRQRQISKEGSCVQAFKQFNSLKLKHASLNTIRRPVIARTKDKKAKKRVCFSLLKLLPAQVLLELGTSIGGFGFDSLGSGLALALASALYCDPLRVPGGALVVGRQRVEISISRGSLWFPIVAFSFRHRNELSWGFLADIESIAMLSFV